MTNPYLPIAQFFTADEYNMLGNTLALIANTAKEQGSQQHFRQAMTLMEKLRQLESTQLEEGLSEEQAKAYFEKFVAALQSENKKALVGSITSWFEALLRVEPDPAQALAQYVTQITLGHMQNTVHSAREEQNHAMVFYGKVLIGRARSKVSAILSRPLPENWKGEGGATNALKYLGQWLKHGEDHLSPEHNAWANDPDCEEVD